MVASTPPPAESPASSKRPRSPLHAIRVEMSEASSPRLRRTVCGEYLESLHLELSVKRESAFVQVGDAVRVKVSSHKVTPSLERSPFTESTIARRRRLRGQQQGQGTPPGSPPSLPSAKRTGARPSTCRVISEAKDDLHLLPSSSIWQDDSRTRRSLLSGVHL